MFKLAALLCVVAAAATAPPRISLDLDAITKMGQASLTQHKDASKQPHSQDFASRARTAIAYADRLPMSLR